MLNAAYTKQYQESMDRMDFVVQSLAEKPGRVIHIAVEQGGERGVQALFDAVMDTGHRMALVKALDAPSLPVWVREKLQVFLYGGSRQTAALFLPRNTLH